jgi:uncharacterized protein (UPF0332 family)/predicted nucleotidyltransferase
MSENPSDIPEMNVEKYSNKKPIIPENTTEVQKEMEKTRKDLEKLKGFILKKFPFTQAIGILPPQAIKLFLEEEEVPKETEKFLHLYMIVPEDKFKEIPNIKNEIIPEMEKLKQKAWLQIKTPVDVWNNGLDSKFELLSAISMSYPIFDTGFLGLLRLTEIHKSLVLQKFEKYVVSYVIGGSFIRGDANKTSDADIFIIINDTDVKRMPRLELRERLRSIIAGQHLQEAISFAGVKNTLHIQTYLLTDFWESVKDAHPVIFTFIRDGVPIYDRGTFMPWKTLLRMGKLKPSPEAIDMFMKTAEQTTDMAERRLIDAMIDVYYGVLNPSQALLMLYGVPPPTHKETPKLMEEIFVKKEKMMKKQDLNVLIKSVKLFKEYEHNPKMKISGSQIEILLKETEEFLKTMKKLRGKIDSRVQEKTIEQVNEDIFGILKGIFGNKTEQTLIKSFERFVNLGKFTSQHLKILKEVLAIKKELIQTKNKKQKQIDIHKIDRVRRNASVLIRDLLDYNQRCELEKNKKGRIRLKYQKEGKSKNAELLIVNGNTFLFEGQIVKKIGDKIEETNMEEVTKTIEKGKENKEVEIKPKVLELLKKEFGTFELIL